MQTTLSQNVQVQLQEGDWDAFSALFAELGDDLRRFIQVRLDEKLRARLDASDILQETQLALFRRLSDYLRQPSVPFRVWVFRTARQQMVDVRRRHCAANRRTVYRERRWPDRSSQLIANRLIARSLSPSGNAVRSETRQVVAAAIAALDEIDREVLLMRCYENRSYLEIAELLEINAVAARKRYGRALLRLRKVLADTGLIGGD